jgi:hypothetical protein
MVERALKPRFTVLAAIFEPMRVICSAEVPPTNPAAVPRKAPVVLMVPDAMLPVPAKRLEATEVSGSSNRKGCQSVVREE